jgi:hypothetical protein
VTYNKDIAVLALFARQFATGRKRARKSSRFVTFVTSILALSRHLAKRNSLSELASTQRCLHKLVPTSRNLPTIALKEAIAMEGEKWAATYLSCAGKSGCMLLETFA